MDAKLVCQTVGVALKDGLGIGRHSSFCAT
jgi:hypothetical protein